MAITHKPMPNGLAPSGGMKHIQTSHRDPVSGKSLHPEQRVGRVSSVTLPAHPTAGTGHGSAFGNKAPAAASSFTNPVVMTLGNPSQLFSQNPKGRVA